VWDSLRESVDMELEQLAELLASYEQLMQAALDGDPGPVELLALAGVLHGFYTGVENIFRLVAREADGALPTGAAWHRELLEQMARPRGRRPAVISMETREELETFLFFRHFFRHAYGFVLNWRRLRPLVTACRPTFGLLRRDLTQFLAEVDAPGSAPA
jgi:hypothetical protein